MTPETDKSPGPNDGAVGLGYEEAGSTVTDDPVEGRGPAETKDHATSAGREADEGASHAVVGPGGAQADGSSGVEPQACGDDADDSVRKAEFQEVLNSKDNDKTANLDLLLDVVVPVSVELGRTSLTVKDILSTHQGSVIELGRPAGEPVDIMVGGKPLARGEVVVVKERFGVRVTELIGSIEGVARA